MRPASTERPRRPGRLRPGLALSLLVLACGPAPPPPPSDAELTAAFRDHRAVFDSLAVDWGGAPLPPEPEGLERRGDRLFAWSRDQVGPGGCSKGYALLSEPPDTTVPSLDRHTRCPPSMVEYRALDGGWYLFFASSD